MIELRVVLKTAPRQIRLLTDALQMLANSVCDKPGCLSVELYHSVVGPQWICYVEIWASEEELRRMLASHHFSQLSALMELASEPLTSEFRFIDQTHGLDYAEQVRDGGNG